MKYSKTILLIPGLAALSLTSCVTTGPGYGEPGISGTVGVYGVYETLPSHYVGDAYYYGGRYYSGGRYERGTYRDRGRVYSDRYQHNGQYYYGGRHEHHGSGGNRARSGNSSYPGGRTTTYPGGRSGTYEASWQENDGSRQFSPRRIR
jgi:hypothetical protein